MLLLTDEDIREDIRNYEERIQAARDKLAALPADTANWKGRKKNKAKRRELKNEITHILKLIEYAKKALEEVYNDSKDG